MDDASGDTVSSQSDLQPSSEALPQTPAYRTGTLRLLIAFGLALAAVEGWLLLVDADWVDVPRSRLSAYQHAGFWQGLLFGWTPNYAAQPYLMFFSYVFVHTGPTHLIGNLLALGWLSHQLAPVTPPGRMAVLLIVSAIGAAIGFVLLSQSPNPVVGASGVVMGLFALWLLSLTRSAARAGRGWGARIALFAAYCLAIVALHLLSLVIDMGVGAWQAHLGGFVAGLLCGGVFALWPSRASQHRVRD